MNAVSKIEAAKPFDAYGAYLREREHSRRMEATLSRALTLLSMECGRRELRGENVEHIRLFIRDASE